MKLELDINSAQNSSLDNISDNLTNSENKTDEVKKMLRMGINLAKEGNRSEARQMLLKVTEIEPENETAWLWLASISEYPEELLIFLQNVLKINPTNERALEWAKQTKTLLSKTFVQRGINASRDNQKDFAKQCFLQGIVHDDNNEMAWLWLASTSDSPEEKLSHLQRVLQINPDNETAVSSLNAVRGQMSQSLLKKANSAAISGDRETSKQILETIMKHTPHLEEAWILKAYLADEYYEKIQAYQKALEINPESEAGQAGLASLQALAPKAARNAAEPVRSVVEEQAAPVENQPTEELERAENDMPEAQADDWPETLVENELAEPVAEHVEAETEKMQVEMPVEETVAVEAQSETAAEPVEFVDNQEAAAEQAVETVVEEAVETVVEETAQEAFVEDAQNESEQLFTAEEPVAEVLPTAEEPAAEETAEEPISAEVQSADETVEPVQNAARPNPPFAVEEASDDEIAASAVSPVEDENSPTQELDEEFARTADAVFSSYQESEPLAEEEPEAEETVAEVQEYQVEDFVSFEESVEYDQPAETTADEQAPVNDPNVETAPLQSAYEHETDSVDYDETGAQSDERAAAQQNEQAADESYVYQSPYFSNNGFEVVSNNEPFVDYQQPTVELSAAEFAEIAAPENEYFEQQREKTTLTEHSNNGFVQSFEPEAEYQTNGFAEAAAEVPVQEAVPAVQEMPAAEQQTVTEQAPATYEAQNQPAVQFEAQPQLLACPFCHFENEVQTIVCHSCQSMLSLSDLEMMLAHQDANQDLLLASIERMEVERTLRDFGVDELTTLGLAYLNARNLRKGFSYLRDASQLNPNDVVLSSKVNFLAIRLNEIEEHDNKAQEVPFQSRTILVVDDSPTVRKLISGKLEKSGHSVISAVDGMDALAKINEVIPDLILLDITMPRLDGYQVCKLIRNNEVTKEIPIIMISGKDGFFDKVRGRMAGSTGYITKPFGPDTLMKTIETYLG